MPTIIHANRKTDRPRISDLGQMHRYMYSLSSPEGESDGLTMVKHLPKGYFLSSQDGGMFPEKVMRNEILRPDIENFGPTHYDLRCLEKWYHPDQEKKEMAGRVSGIEIFNHLEETRELRNHLSWADLLGLLAKLPEVQKWLGPEVRSVPGYKSVFAERNQWNDPDYDTERERRDMSKLHVPILDLEGWRGCVRWQPLHFPFFYDSPSLCFK